MALMSWKCLYRLDGTYFDSSSNLASAQFCGHFRFSKKIYRYTIIVLMLQCFSLWICLQIQFEVLLH